MPLNVELLVESFERIKPSADEFGASFYENLFKAHPEVKPLFAKTNMAKQEKKLLKSLVLVIENLRNPEALEEALNALGARHVGYGAIPKDYPAVGEALLMTFEQYLQEDWTPEVRQAWVDAYSAITAQMLKGAGADNAPEKVQIETEAIPDKQVAYAPATQALHQLEEVPDSEFSDLDKPSELKAKVIKESKQFQPEEAEQQKKPLVSIQWDNEILKEIIEDMSNSYQQFKSKLPIQWEKSKLPIQWEKSKLPIQWDGERLKQSPGKIIDSFWRLPVGTVAAVAAVIMLVIFLVVDENSLLGKVLGGADAICLAIALVLFIKEAPDRKKQFHYQAWSTVDAARDKKVSLGRIQALQDLNEDGVSLKGLDTPGAELAGINLPNANLSEASLSETDLSNANLSHANLNNANLSQAKLIDANLSHANVSFARLSQANLSGADLSSANLMSADLSHANMRGVNLKNASLSGANLEGAHLTGANLKDAKVSIAELSGALLESAIMPDGSKHQD